MFAWKPQSDPENKRNPYKYLAFCLTTFLVATRLIFWTKFFGHFGPSRLTQYLLNALLQGLPGVEPVRGGEARRAELLKNHLTRTINVK